MKLFRFCSTAVLSLLMAGVLVAQTPQQPPPTSRPDQQPPRATQPATPAADAAEMTIVGCLAQSKDDSDDFVLTVSPAGAQQAAGAAASGTDATRATNPTTGAAGAARTAASATPATYKIVGIDDDQLKPHLNHQVELKGRLNASAAPDAAAPAAGASMQPKEFRATAVKMLNATCPPAR
jgi:hypothetical protein